MIKLTYMNAYQKSIARINKKLGIAKRSQQEQNLLIPQITQLVLDETIEFIRTHIPDYEQNFFIRKIKKYSQSDTKKLLAFIDQYLNVIPQSNLKLDSRLQVFEINLYQNIIVSE